MNFLKNRVFISSYDTLAAIISMPLAFMVRYESPTNPILYAQITVTVYILSLVSKIIAFRIFRISRGFWSYFGTQDFSNIVKALGVSTLSYVVVLFVAFRTTGLPRSVIFIDFMICLALLSGGRVLYRSYIERRAKRKSTATTRVLLIGAGDAGAQLIKDANYNTQTTVEIAAIFDDDVRTHGRFIQGVKVVGSIDKIAEYADATGVRDVVIAIPSASAPQIRRIVELCEKLDLGVKTLPALSDIVKGKVHLSNIRPIDINDLLARDPVLLQDNRVTEFLHDKIVMVTGAGGSIGSELCKQIMKHQPKKLLAFEMCEYFIYRLDLQLREKFPNVELIPVVGDVRDPVRVENIMKHYRPQIVFHAAAYKHVPMMEVNEGEAVKTNVLGTQNVAALAAKYEVEHFVMISTDKAVNPTNIMGATKRVAEMVCISENEKGRTKYSILRFGNVLGSAGSVIPLFQEQIRNGGPVTVTHPEITRYFMSIPEATELVLETSVLGQGGEIFVLEMGNPVKIVDLAKDLIRLSGYELGRDIEIEFTGLRPGEKLYEELLSDLENTKATAHKKVRTAICRNNPLELNDMINYLATHVEDSQKVREALKILVPEFKPKPQIQVSP